MTRLFSWTAGLDETPASHMLFASVLGGLLAHPDSHERPYSYWIGHALDIVNTCLENSERTQGTEPVCYTVAKP